ncbi:MAG: ABC transporter permease [Gammaproteobacteria bacterium]|nr:ABC transporter permease [Gammaproteobacteria bacterium]MCW8909646.1 ABC transporter permease [Gammaproteobacteria bacterium]MCW9005959.1 ABC transporter permease [Gammaproteobacteria bacterium]MCW9055300.1 ABC transporter permease [Gammaproteobacteria bacterium]
MSHITSLLMSLAWRNLWRNKRRTLVILFAIVLGVWAMIFTAAFMRGMSSQILSDTINNLTGHIQIHSKQYLDDPVIDHRFSLIDDQLFESLNNVLIKQTSSRVRVPAVIVSERESTGLVMVGINPDNENGMSFLQSSIVEGRYLKDENDSGIIIGRKLAERLETRLGKRVVIMSQDKDNKIVDRGFRIVGIFDTQMEALETGYIFMGLQTSEDLLNIKNEVSEVSILLHDMNQLDELVADLQQQNPHLDVQGWAQLEPMSRVIIELYDSFHLVWHLIVFLAMGFGIVNTLLMSVFERTREFGLFQSLGLKPGFIMGQVWVESTLLLMLGLFLGNIIAWWSVLATGEGIDVSAFAQGMEMANLSNIIPFVIITKDLVLANSVVIILGMLTSIYPAWRASRLVPADAITRV